MIFITFAILAKKSSKPCIHMVVPFRIDTDHAYSLHAVHSVYSLTRGLFNGPLIRCVKLRFAHAPGLARKKFTATMSLRYRHAPRNVRHARAGMHVGAAEYLFPLKSVAEKTFPTFPAHEQPAILRIWLEAHICTPVWIMRYSIHKALWMFCRNFSPFLQHC